MLPQFNSLFFKKNCFVMIICSILFFFFTPSVTTAEEEEGEFNLIDVEVLSEFQLVKVEVVSGVDEPTDENDDGRDDGDDNAPSSPADSSVIPQHVMIISEDMVSLDIGKLQDYLDNNSNLGEFVLLNTSQSVSLSKAIIELFIDKNLLIQQNDVTYYLPAEFMQLVSEQLTDGAQLIISMKKVDSTSLDNITLLAPMYDFTIYIQDTDSHTVLGDFNFYMKRQFTMEKEVNPDISTGALYDPQSGEFSFVPSIFEALETKTIASLWSRTNSIYTVIENPINFKDMYYVPYKDIVHKMAAKLITTGTTDETFSPFRTITRHEFTTLMVRALGAATMQVEDYYFIDVLDSDWYANNLQRAYMLGLVEGYGDQTFKPKQPITRQQMAAILYRALQGVGQAPDVNEERPVFTDWQQINKWAQPAVATMTSIGVMEAQKDGNFAPYGTATRLDAIVMIEKFLRYVHFID
ncbi:S-layer homology domain-containing protein [Bacillus salinus]|uniref:S-layer homology domain-containing protein n=1 Tax=Bacillus sp. HMF5848 TaxID=2495421 RepID=UPI00163B58BC|nr:S-layer homology domain-containing protein [Bacillus sp. HMF5848]